MTLPFAALLLSLQTPNFAGTIVTPKMSARSGALPLVAILWDPGRPDHLAPSKESIEDLLFGKNRSVAGWWQENSGGRSTLQMAGVLGWYKSDFPADHYWRAESEDKGRTGFLSGHVEKWAEAIRKADKEFDFAKYDRNRNGSLEPTELGILFVIPQNGPFGTMRQPAGREVPAWEPLTVDGIRIPAITEAYIGTPPNLGLVAHELSHLLLGAPDMYLDAPHRAGAFSIMDVSYRSVHLGPFEKLKLGWLKPRVVSRAGEYPLRDVESSGEAILVWDPDRGAEEYFLIENRWRGSSYDADGLPADGLVVWHIFEEPKDFLADAPDRTAPDDWGRWGVRLLRSRPGSRDVDAFFEPKILHEFPWRRPGKRAWHWELDGDPGNRVKVRIRVR